MRIFPLPFVACVVAAMLFTPTEASAQVYVSEILADNQINFKVDEDGDHADWLELWNSGPATVNLNGWYLTDNSGDLRKWRFPVTTPPVNIAAGARLVIWCSAKNRKLDATKLHTNFKLAKEAGSYIGLVREDGLTVEHSFTYPQQVQDISYGVIADTALTTLVAEGAPGRAKVPLSAGDMPADVNTGWHTPGFDDSAWQAGNGGFGYDTANTYGALIGAGGDLQAAMYTVNASALVRVPFNVTDPNAVASLRLSMKYDDGFNCYLNGHLIQQSFSGGGSWDSGAASDRSDGLTSSFQVFTPSNAQQWLVPGNNVLAIQMLNFSNGSTEDKDSFGVANGSRALCLPMLEATVTTGTVTIGYLNSATPGAGNSTLRTSLGPSIGNTTNKPARPVGGGGSAPIVITTKITPSLRPLAVANAVRLGYRIMFGGEATVIMRDDGVAPDLVSGDGVFSANIPTTSVPPGQMLRWRITAVDNAGASATDPPFRDPTDNEQYYGTVALDDITTSQLPVMHWFVADANASRSTGGTRCALFFLGDFYDNVYVNLHGQSSSGFPVMKKSHNFNFNEDNRFKWKTGEKRQRAINLITTWADKSHVRDTMAWESWGLTGHLAGHWAQMTRVQQNGVFWGVYDMVENGDEDFIDRSGLDKFGVLYKVYNSLQDTGGVEKKTADFNPSRADLQTLITAMDTGNPLINRRRDAYDMVDVPSLVNYLATNVVLINNDFGHKNYYIYRDTYGTREWSLLPWDQDLSLGHTWTGSQAYFNDDIDSQRGLVLGASTGNRVMNLISNNNSSTVAPEMARMFLRRLRTLMDQLLVSATATDGPFEQRINQLLYNLDPPGAAYLTDGDLDLQKWGYWLDGSGNAIAPNNNFDAAIHDHGPRRSAMRIMSSNPNPPYPAAVSNAEGLGNTTPAFLPGRRSFLFNSNPTLIGIPIPPSQAAVPTGLVIEYVEANPASGKQSEEFFIIRNDSADYVDISGWKITGGVSLTFRGGTVIPPFTSGSAITATGDVHAGRLHVARDQYGFRQRTVSPRGTQWRLVTGGYSGQLSARGETINLVIPGVGGAADITAATTTYAAAPTAAQDYLRVTELAFNPANPSPSETTALPGVQGRDFEFVELINNGPAPLDIGGATFSKGIDFTFPTGFTLQPGQRCVIVSLLAAYNLRHSGAGALVAGQFEGNLDNAGETLQLVDNVGEVILNFTYHPLWFGVPATGNPLTTQAPQGYSIVTTTNNPAWNSYETPSTWALSGDAGGSPGAGDTSFSNTYIGWRKAFFTPLEEASPVYSAPTSDPEPDGRTNFEEYVWGGNPQAFDSAVRPEGTIVNVGGVDYLAITFNRRHNAIDTVYTVEGTSVFDAWTPVNIPFGTPIDLGNGLERVTYRDSQPHGATPRFLRVRAVR